MEPENQPTNTPNESPEKNLSISNDERTMGMLTHLLGIFTGFAGPLIIWLVKKDEMPFVDKEGKEALNFQITLFIGYVISWFLCFIIIGIFTFAALMVLGLVFGIMGTMKANNGESYRYPLSIRFIS